ncbi:transforming acidic coiled-coil-containing protein 1-like isoform X3 [Biomphalaria glabrata]|uniref:Transforming acidic coiled-coil-containing protein 1-like isoform X3 n=1 Tax=Biomphalaria glabrata TaxID=6526 RepID=A0A9W2Z6M1_BIOGL|nr:transforming acidic coiled-coil-containing protein 1-like isoform X3 [Biomphalaria glabrata]
MSEENKDSVPSSPPLQKKGSYDIDFDALDDSVNPFAPKVKLGSSPPIRAGNLMIDENVDPFKPKKKLVNSPPRSPITAPESFSSLGTDLDRSVALSENGRSEDTDGGNNHLDSSVNIKESHSGSESIPKPKKVIKKPKMQSKLKPPKSIKSPQIVSDEIQVSDSSFEVENKPLAESSPMPSKISPKKYQSELSNDIETTYHKNLTQETNLGTEHHFDEHDNLDGELANEGFAPLGEVFDNDLASSNSAFQKEESVFKRRDEASFSDSFSSEKPSRPSPSHTPKVLKQREDDAVLNTPPQVKKVEDSYLTPESPQKDISRGSDKNESSSEDSQFYDAFDYPPAPSTKSKLGQKNSSGMERGSSSQDEGGNNKDAVVQLVQVLRYSQSDWKKMKQELELNFQASLLNKEREWSLMLGERDKKISSLEDANAKLKHTNDEMRMIVADFEKTISQLQAEKDKTKTDSKKMIQSLESERDQAVEDLQSVESAFSDLHRRYEKSKSIIEGFKRNEEQLKQCVEDLQGKLKKAEGKLQAIRSQAEEKLDKANEDIEKIKKSTKQDIIRLEAALKKAELRTSNLEESLQRKEKENQELTAICDELISKVGS